MTLNNVLFKWPSHVNFILFTNFRRILPISHKHYLHLTEQPTLPLLTIAWVILIAFILIKQYKYAIQNNLQLVISHSRSGLNEELCPLRWSFCPLCRSVWSFYAGYQIMCLLSLVPSSSWCYAACAHCVSLNWCPKWGRWFERSSRVSKRYFWWVNKSSHLLPVVAQ